MKNPLVSIVLLNYKTLSDTVECIESLFDCNYNNYNIILVDNASNDNCCTYVNQKYPSVITIQNDKNIGFAAGCNVGIKKALDLECDFVLLLNNDTIVEKDFLKILVDTFSLDPRIGIATGKILYYDNMRIWYGGGHISKLRGVSKIEHLEEEDRYDIQGGERTFASGCCMLISRKVIENVGNLTEDYFLYFEDTDYCMKVQNMKFKIFFNPKAIIYHKESRSTQKRSKLYSYYICRNRLLFISENISSKYWIPAYIYSLAYVIKKVAVHEFNLKYAFVGVKDGLLRIKGKRDVFL